MNISFNLELSTSKGSNEEQSILIRCTLNRKHKRISTGLSVPVNSWDKTHHKVRKSHPLAVEYNNLLLEKLKKITSVYAKLLGEKDNVSLDDIIIAFNSNTSVNFYEFTYRTKMAEIKIDQFTNHNHLNENKYLSKTQIFN
jgi:hypothetical protein